MRARCAVRSIRRNCTAAGLTFGFHIGRPLLLDLDVEDPVTGRSLRGVRWRPVPPGVGGVRRRGRGSTASVRCRAWTPTAAADEGRCTSAPFVWVCLYSRMYVSLTRRWGRPLAVDAAAVRVGEDARSSTPTRRARTRSRRESPARICRSPSPRDPSRRRRPAAAPVAPISTRSPDGDAAHARTARA